MHEDENTLCPFVERKLAVSRLSALCKIRVGPNKEIHHLAKSFQQETKISSKDAIHLACAFNSRSRYFLTCDDELIKQAKKLKLKMEIMNPVEYIREVEIQ